MNEKESEIKDLYNGNLLQIWEDGEFVTLSLMLTTISVPKEDWEQLKKELSEVSKT